MIKVFQLAFLLMLSLDNMTPVMDSLKGLEYSLGYNHLGDYNSLQRLDREFIAIKFNESFIKNYNFTFLTIALPLILALVFKILSKALNSNAERAERMQKYYQLTVGYYSFYGFMFSSYLIFVSLIIAVLLLKNGNTDYMSIGIGGVFLVAAVIYEIFLYKLPEFFWEFK